MYIIDMMHAFQYITNHYVITQKLALLGEKYVHV